MVYLIIVAIVIFIAGAITVHIANEKSIQNQQEAHEADLDECWKTAFVAGWQHAVDHPATTLHIKFYIEETEK